MYWVKLIGLFCLVALFWAWHGHSAFTLPTMACEDGQVMFAYYLSQPSPWGIFRFYYGYISLLPNLIGYLSAQLPPTWSPYLLAYFALVIKALAHTLFALRRFRAVIPSDNLRWWICLLLALLPLGNVQLLANTTYSIWNLLWILLLLTYAPLGSSRLGQVAQFSLLALCIWSHPLAIVVGPILLYNLFTRPTERWFNGGLLLLLVLYLTLGVEWGYTERPRSLTASVVNTPFYLLNRVVFEAFFGYHLRLLLYSTGRSWLIYLVALLVVTGLAVWYTRRWRQLTWPSQLQLGLAVYVIGALTWLTIYTRAADRTIYMGEWNHRYFYIQQLLLWLGLIVALVRERQPQPLPNGTQRVPASGPLLREGTVNSRASFLSNWDRSYHTPNEETVPPLTGGRLGRGAFALRVTSLTLLLAYLATLNYYHWNYLRTWPEDGRRLAEFLQEVEDYQQSGPHEGKREFFLKRDCFDIQVEL
jgi:hypothetical protein